jgi:hypothetical protein
MADAQPLATRGGDTARLFPCRWRGRGQGSATAPDLPSLPSCSRGDPVGTPLGGIRARAETCSNGHSGQRALRLSAPRRGRVQRGEPAVYRQAERVSRDAVSLVPAARCHSHATNSPATAPAEPPQTRIRARGGNRVAMLPPLRGPRLPLPIRVSGTVGEAHELNYRVARDSLRRRRLVAGQHPQSANLARTMAVMQSPK